MSSSKPKKHHYVPQFILNNFSQGKNRRIFVFDKQLSKVFPSNVKDIGHENHFYKDTEQSYEIDTETKLAELENNCAPIIEKILREETIKNISTCEHMSLCLFVAVQLTRTKKTRNLLTHFNQSIVDWAKQSGISPNEIENFKDQTPDEIKESSIYILRTISGDLAKNLLNKEYLLVKCPKGKKFYTSDNPITLHNYFPREGRGNLGLGLKGIEIHFPISSKLCISFMCSKTINEMRKTCLKQQIKTKLGVPYPSEKVEPIEKFVDTLDNKLISELLPQNVEFHNSLQVIQSSRFIYSENKSFTLAKDMLETEPELADPLGGYNRF